jgi:glycosyltransferase involved in cell wall biosynthesis
MRILYIGDYKTQKAEGMRIISEKIPGLLSSRHTILCVDTKSIFSFPNLKKLREFDPEIVHYLTGPTLRSFIILKLLKFLFRDVHTISSAVRPYFSGFDQRFIKWILPDCILTQDHFWEDIFLKNKGKVFFIPNGVDTKVYFPVSKLEKNEIRKKYGLVTDKPIILHIGHIKENRNLDRLVSLQKSNNYQVLIVASPNFQPNPSLYQRLLAEKITIINSYITEIQDLYKASDVYIFPVNTFNAKLKVLTYNEIGVIDMPLSVLEAMSTNLPVISTKFPALIRALPTNNEIHWINNEDSISSIDIDNLISKPCSNRDTILPFDWNNIGSQIEDIYFLMASND